MQVRIGSIPLILLFGLPWGQKVIKLFLLSGVVLLKFFLGELPGNGRIPVVFDGIVSSAWKVFRYEGPLIAESILDYNILLMVFDYFLVFFFGPFFLIYIGIEVVMPSLSALLAHPAF